MDAISWLVSHAGDGALWALGFVGSWLLAVVTKHVSARAIVLRALQEVGAAVFEVAQTFVSNLKLAAVDGKLTKNEVGEAKRRALELAKSNIGVKGLKRLAKVLGIEDIEAWLGNKIESSIASAKLTSPGVPSPFGSATYPRVSRN